MNDTMKNTSPAKEENKAYRQAARLGRIFFISILMTLFIPVSGDLWTGISVGYAVGAAAGLIIHQCTLHMLDPQIARMRRLHWEAQRQARRASDGSQA